MVPINDKDLISLGANLTPNNCGGKDASKKFLFRVEAPKQWEEEHNDSETDLEETASKFHEF